MTISVLQKFATVLLLVALPQFLSTTAEAEVTKWQDLGGGRVRLVTIYDPINDLVEGIIDVELQPGWVTYWRNPGQSGIPPNFNFSKSSGVIVSEPEFPVPVSKEFSGIVSIVYKNHVAFPFKATPVISPLSGMLKLELLMGVCDIICIPATASLSQDLVKLNKSDVVSNSMIELAKRKLPIANGNDPGLPKILPKILTATSLSKSTVLISAYLPEATKNSELFAEGKDSWFFYPAKLLRHEGTQAQFELSLSDLPKGADLSKIPLRLTLTADGTGVEHTIFVDQARKHTILRQQLKFSGKRFESCTNCAN